MDFERGKQWACVCASFLSLRPHYLASLECAEGLHACHDAVSCFGCPGKIKCHHVAALRHGVRDILACCMGVVDLGVLQ